MTKQTEAQRLAERLKSRRILIGDHGAPLDEAADELLRLDKIESEWAALSQDEGKSQRQIDRLEAANAELVEALLVAARSAEALKRECSMSDPESAQATRNTQYMSISYAARAAIKKHGGAE